MSQHIIQVHAYYELSSKKKNPMIYFWLNNHFHLFELISVKWFIALSNNKTNNYLLGFRS